MKKLLDNFDKKQFISLSIILGVIGDIILLGYLYIKFSDKERFSFIMSEVLKEVTKQDPNLAAGFSQQHVEQIFALMVNALVMLLLMVAVFHIFIFYFYSKEKNFAKTYLKIYAFLACPGFLLFAIGTFSGNILWSLVFIAGAFMYFFQYKGIKYHLPN